MRRATLIALSLAANAALGVVLYQRLSLGHTSAPIATSPTISRSTAATVPALSDSQRWREISATNDDTAFVTALRSAGFPPHVILALTRERVSDRYAARLRELKQKSPQKPYWQTDRWYDSALDLAGRTEQRAINREIADTVKSLLGADAEVVSSYQREQRARSYGDLPSAKVPEIEIINRDYRELAEQIRDDTQGVTIASDREKLAFLEKEKRADLAAVLSPEELDEYDRRNSPSASEIRNKLRYFDATESEYLALYRLQRDFDARYGRDNLSGEQTDLRKAALPELAKQMETALGPERYADFQVLSDGNYYATRSVMNTLGLPPEKATDLVRIQRAANQRAASIRDDKSLNAEQRSAQLATLEKEATEKISATLGPPENLASYKKYGAGQWLTRLAPPAKITARP